MTLKFQHKSVLAEEILSQAPLETKTFIDCTLGGAGHSTMLLQKFPSSFLYGIDRDPVAIQAATQKLTDFPDRFRLISKAFSLAIQDLVEEGVQVDYIIADLGVSSPQLDEAERGFSFRQEGPLDMRMNPQDPMSAADVVNQYEERDLARIFRIYGEEKFASRIAKAIVARRETQLFHKTRDLSEVIVEAIPKKFQFKRIHPSTKVFQAIRIEVNRELEELGDFLKSLLPLLAPQGRVGIISFHSLEDRLIKNQFKEWVNPCHCPPELPQCICGLKPLVKAMTRKPIQALDSEKDENPRARSAKFRVVEKL